MRTAQVVGRPVPQESLNRCSTNPLKMCNGQTVRIPNQKMGNPKVVEIHVQAALRNVALLACASCVNWTRRRAPRLCPTPRTRCLKKLRFAHSYKASVFALYSWMPAVRLAKSGVSRIEFVPRRLNTKESLKCMMRFGLQIRAKKCGNWFRMPSMGNQIYWCPC